MVSSTLALLTYSMIYVSVKQGGGPGTLWVQSVQINAWGGGRNHSLTRPLTLQRSVPLRSVPLRNTPLAGSFVSEKVAMY